ncbi:putative ribonuclease H-like domain-containing protein [Tanacetum coccineum]
MNYEPVTVGNQTNKNARIKDNVDVVHTQQYILLPLLSDSLQSSKDVVSDDAGKKTNAASANKCERNGQENEGGASNKEDDQNVQDFTVALDNLLVQHKKGYANNTNIDSTVSPSVSAAGQSGAYDDEEWVQRTNVYYTVSTGGMLDDIIFGLTKKYLCTEFESLMHKKFQMSSMGELNFFLGLQVMQIDDGIFISQDQYVADILKKFDFVTIKTTSTLTETNKALLKDEKAEDVDVHLYRSMIRSLMIFRYLKGQPNLGLWYPRDSPFDLEAFSNSNYAGASLDRKSTIGGCQFLGKRLISWQCKKQTVVANSTTKEKYVVATNCCRQMLWIQNQMLDYRFNFMNTKIYIDNESTICIVKNLVFHSKTKHIEIRHHFIRDSYEKKLIQVIKIHTDHNVADLLTKAFDVSRKAKRTTEISQSSGPIPLVTDETVIKEWEDRMERAATTASSLEAEQDSEAQTRFKAASKQSNDPPLLRVNTLGSGEDSMKSKEIDDILYQTCLKGSCFVI